MATNKKQSIIFEYLEKYKDQPSLTIARAIYKKHKLLWTNVESVRTSIRRYRGNTGDEDRAETKNKTFFREPKNVTNPFAIPKETIVSREPYKLPVANNNILWLSDLHIPYHSTEAITAALSYGKKHKVNTIVIGGDLMDFAKLSRFEADPEHRDTVHEFETAIQFLKALRKAFPTVDIIFIKGNHDERYEKWLQSKCIELFNDPYYSFENRLGLKELRIKLIDGHTVVKAGKLNLLHGDKIVKGVFAPVNSARGAYMKAKANLLIGHTHQVSEHSEGDLNGGFVATWSTGCLCELHPKYDSFNVRHTHGFAHIMVERNGNFRVKNYKIINGEIY